MRNGSARGPTAGPLMFHRLADQYDALTSGKDTRKEVEHLEALARRYARSGGGSWLDVACGTGRHLELLRRRHEVVGVDRSAAMLRIARRRLPSTRLLRGDMRTLRLDEEFDVVSCLFSAIAHLRSEAELGAAFRTFAAHLKPGGICLVEPWIDPSNFRSGFVQLVGHAGPDGSVARMAFSRRQGKRSVVRYEYLVGDARRGIRHFAEDDVGLLVPRQRLLDLMAAAGLRARYLERGLTPGRGLLLGRKPWDRRRSRPRTGGTSRVPSDSARIGRASPSARQRPR
jgi:ubiquinone/menaquinone biosynthesis C-methylase UbiE